MGRVELETALLDLPQIATDLLKTYKETKVFCFYGELGAGKTTLIKEFLHQIEHIDQDEIQSPTFLMCNVYEKCAHFDLYRLKNPQEFLNMGFDELF